MTAQLSTQEIHARIKLRDDFPFYAEKCLRIRTKAGKVLPFKLNTAQRYIHERLEEQKAKTGKVRALILKARQQGASTYLGGRLYHQTTHQRGMQTFILTHEQDATDNLFGMVERYHDHCPSAVKPQTGASNAKELSFDILDSGYSVGTAGSKAVGRSKTVQKFHGSEVAFWPNAAAHFAGVVQAIPDLPDTEVCLESTANGIGGEFHERWQQAERGEGDYIAIFIPWFWSDEYRRPVPEDFVRTDEEQKLVDLHGSNGLTDDEQLVWRRAKIAELKDPLLFKQEYPATAEEAFQVTGHDSFIKPEDVLAARNRECAPVGPLVCGGDPARFDDDAFAVAWRTGRQVSKVERRYNLSVVEGANWIKEIIDTDAPAKFFVDAGGLGIGVIDLLHSFGGKYEKIVIGVNFGSAPRKPPQLDDEGKELPGPLNRRAEMWLDSRDWLQDELGADIPDDNALHSDACGPGYSYDSNQRIQLESKQQMRKRGQKSPDGWDSVVLTFAEPAFEAEKDTWVPPEALPRSRSARRIGDAR